MKGGERRNVKARMARLKRTGKRLGNGWARMQRSHRKTRRRKTAKTGYQL